MKKTLLLLLSIAAFTAIAQTSPTPNALRLDQRNAANTAYVSKFVPPASSNDCLVWMASATAGATPQCAILGSAFTNAGGVINVPVTSGAQGPIGPQGAQGAPGNDGAAGPQGVQGPIGPAGPTGATGPAGTDGAQGPTGAQGPMGATGPTGATGSAGPAGAQGIQGPTGTTGAQGLPGISDFGTPITRIIALATAYQATNTAKAALVNVTLSCDASLSLTGGTNCTGEVRIGSTNSVATGGGTVIGTYRNQNTGTLTIGLALSQGVSNTISVFLPAGWYFAVRQTSSTGLTVATAVDQSTSP